MEKDNIYNSAGSHENGNGGTPDGQNKKVFPNLFLGRIDGEPGNSSFPDWDILPPNQFINPRIKN